MIHDVDKNSDDRSSPSPNIFDKLPADTVMARGTQSTNYTTAPPNTQGIPGVQLGVLSLVQVGVANVVASGAAETVTTVQHNLGFAPYVIGAINGATVTGISGLVNVFLPTWLAVTTTEGNITFVIYTSTMSDNTSLYIYTINASGGPFSIEVTYYLYRQQAAQ